MSIGLAVSIVELDCALREPSTAIFSTSSSSTCFSCACTVPEKPAVADNAINTDIDSIVLFKACLLICFPHLVVFV